MPTRAEADLEALLRKKVADPWVSAELAAMGLLPSMLWALREIDQLRKEKAWALLIGRAAERADAIAHARERARGLRVLSRSVLHHGRALALNELAGELERSEHVGKAVSVDEQRKCPVDIQNALGGEVDADWVQQVVERLGDIKQPHIEVVTLRRRLDELKAMNDKLRRRVVAAMAALRSDRATSASVRDEAIRILEGSNG